MSSTPPWALPPGNPMTKVLVSVVAFEVIVFGLAIFVMTRVSQVPLPEAAVVCSVAAVLALFAAASLRSPRGFVVGWLAQIAAVCLGFWTPVMFLMGGLFAMLWVISFVLGRRLARTGAHPQPQ